MSKTSYQTKAPEDLFIPGVDTKDKEGRFTLVRPANYKYDKALLASIRSLGVLVAVNVVTVKFDGVDRETVKDGRRRVMHAREVNRMMDKEGDKSPRIRVPIKHEGDAGESEEAETMFYLQAEAANTHRADDDQLTRAERWLRLKARGSEVEAIAISAGVSAQTVKAGLRVAEKAGKFVRGLLKDEKINFTTAANLCKIDGDEEQKKAYEELAAEAEDGRVTSTKAKAKAKGKGSGGGAQTRTAKDMRDTLLGLQLQYVAHPDKTKEDREYKAQLLAQMNAITFYLCDGYATGIGDDKESKVMWDRLHVAQREGERARKDKGGKGKAKSAEEAGDGDE